MTLEAAKRALRAVARARRAALVSSGAGERLAERFLAQVPLAPDATVAGYWPMGDEIDVRPLLARVHALGRVSVLPVTGPRGTSLGFRRWRPGDALTRGVFGTSEPAPDRPEARPSLLLVPLLAVDGEGWRLGYGAGYYDRTLRALRRTGPVLAVGIGYAAQMIDAVPHGSDDEPVDWIVTESWARQIGSWRRD
ncbi:MAG: 5-formyltetrahydrofolate cyclo-ligase [Alphaproteobacteria bacterium]|nr:5-formyltetrahydrofolate cyclo-ligase [Alphaproteobacteria bacterium]